MYRTTIINPTTKRENSVKAWDLTGRQVLDDMIAGRITGPRDVSWQLLNGAASVEAGNVEDGDSADTNWALNVFEHALDWGLGLAVLNFIKDFRAQRGANPRQFTVACNRQGQVFIVLQMKDGSKLVLSY